MKNYTKEETIQYRIKQAKESAQTARFNFENNVSSNFVANRLYYACFYTAIAYLAKHDIDYKSHKSVKTAFSDLLIKPKLIDTSFSKMYSQLFELRQKGDYNDHYDIENKQIEPYLSQVEQLIEIIEKLLAEN